MATKEDVRNALLERMTDLTISTEAFDEYVRRLSLLDPEE